MSENIRYDKGRHGSPLRIFWQAIKKAALDFINDNGFKLSASLSFSTLFAVGPLLIVVISLTGIFFGKSAVEGRIYEQIKDMVGSDTAIQVQDYIRHIQDTRHTVAGAILGGIVLILAATGVFTEIQGSINYMWSIQTKPKKGWLKFLLNRLLSFSLIIAFGFISLVALVVNSLMDVLSGKLTAYFSYFTVYVFYSVNLVLTLAAIILLFAIIFKILPDAVLRWRDSFAGALFTGIFFLTGKYLIGIYVGNSNLGATYGAATSIVVILTWVYYSSIILYLGAEFTKTLAAIHNRSIQPARPA